MPPRTSPSSSPERSGPRSWRRSTTAGLGLSTFVSAGNRADVSGNATCCGTGRTSSTEVVLSPRESIDSPRKVLPHRPAGVAASDHRRTVRPHHRERCRCGARSLESRRAPAAAVDLTFNGSACDPGRHAGRDVSTVAQPGRPPAHRCRPWAPGHRSSQQLSDALGGLLAARTQRAAIGLVCVSAGDGLGAEGECRGLRGTPWTPRSTLALRSTPWSQIVRPADPASPARTLANVRPATSATWRAIPLV